MNILVTGGTGFIGHALVQSLIEHQHVCIVWCRHPSKIPQGCRAVTELTQIDSQQPIDAVINLAGSPIDRRWTPAVKHDLMQSRVQTTETLMRYLKSLLVKPKVLIQASAVGYYGPRQTGTVTESTAPNAGFTHTLCQAWEHAAEQGLSFGMRVVIARFGVVLGHARALKRMALPFRFYVGSSIASGAQMVSWVHLHDVIQAIHYLMQATACQGAYNVTAPMPTSNKALSTAIAKTLHRPLWFNMPECVVRVLFGEMGEQLLLDSQSVIPERLLDAGFKFKFESVEQAIADLL